MMGQEPKLYDLVNGKPIPAPSCYTIEKFKAVIDYYGEDSGQIFAAITNLYSLNPENNPYANLPEEHKWEEIRDGMLGYISHEPIIDVAKEYAERMFMTTPYRAFRAFKNLMEKIIVEIETADVDLTKDSGNMQQIKHALGTYKELKNSYNDSFQEYIKSIGFGETLAGREKAYDEDDVEDDEDY